MKRYQAEGLDLVQSCYIKENIPIIYCYMTLESRINIERLRRAVEQTTKTVPQILCLYQVKDHSWYPAWDNVEPFIVEIPAEQNNTDLTWDLTVGPQLKIFIQHGEKADRIIFAMSHLLTDGRGFQQYLKLLNDCYNNEKTVAWSNHRNLWEMPIDIDKKSSYRKTKKILFDKKRGQLSDEYLLPKSNPDELLIHNNIKVVLNTKQMTQIISKAKNIGVTLNDYMMAAYAATIFRMGRQKQILLPVPADLRKKFTKPIPLTIANMTGKYLCCIEKSETVDQLARQIHQSMMKLKRRNACVQNLSMLRFLEHKMPSKILILLIRHFYHIESVSYTNLGILQFGMEDKNTGIDNSLQFDKSLVTSCYMCGMYRMAPSFQVSVSTYMQEVTLSANVIGTIEQQEKAKNYLKKIKDNLLFDT